MGTNTTTSDTTEQPRLSLGRLFWTSLPSTPWKGFFWGLFLPLVSMEICQLLQSPMLGVGLAIGICVLFFIVDFVQTRQPSPFAIITLFMFTTKFAAGVMGTHWPQHAKALSFATIFDEGAIALLFFVSLATRYPLVLIFLGEHALAAIPEKIRRSSHYLPAWKLVTLLWAVLYAIQTIVFAVLLYYEIAWRNVVEFIFGWPIVALFLVMSVMLPRWYWTKHGNAIEREIETASQNNATSPAASE